MSDSRVARRWFVTHLPLVLVAAPRVAEAQPAGRPARVGVLLMTARTSTTGAVDHLRSALRESGHEEGRTIVFEYRAAEGKVERLPELARELSALKVDVIYAATAPAALAAKQATSTIPVVFSGIPDPVGAGLVASLARPGGNVTGVALEATPAQAAKQLEVLKELVPSVTRVGIFGAPGLRPSLRAHERVLEGTQAKLGLAFSNVQIGTVAELDEAFDVLARERVEALWLIAPAAFQGRGRIADYALKHRLPAIAPYREFVDVGGLVSFGASFAHNHRRAAVYAAPIR